MVAPHDVDYLQPGERVVIEARRHPLSAVDAYIGWTLLSAILVTASLVVGIGIIGGPGVAYGVTAAVVAGIGYIVAMVVTYWRRATSLYVVTPERVYGSHGRIRFHLTQTTYDKVTDLHLHQSLFGRIWDYGTVRVQTAGTGLALAGVSDPVGFKQRIEAERDQFLRRLVADHRGRRSKRPAPDAPKLGEASVLWTGRPTGASVLGNLVMGSILLLVSLSLLVVGATVALQALLVGGFLLFISLGSFMSAFIQLKYTHFEVSDEGVALRRGWLSRRRVEATYGKVTDVAVAQDILGRMLGFGSITINTAGSNEAPVVFAGVAEPDEIKALIDQARRRASQ